MVHYGASSPLELVGFSDSDSVGNTNDRKSTSVYVLIIYNGTILWSRKEQHTISLYLAEVEYRGVVNATTQCVWL